MDVKVTKEEQSLITNFKNEKFSCVNQWLSSDLEKANPAEYTQQNVRDNFELVGKIYRLMLRFFHHKPKKEKQVFYKAVSMAEIDKLKNTSEMNQFLLARVEQAKAEEDLVGILNRPALLQIELAEEIPVLPIQEELSVIISPFTKVDLLQENQESQEDKKVYQLVLEAQEMKYLEQTDKKEWLETICKSTNSIFEKIKNCLDIDEENASNYENIRKLEQLLAKHNFAMEQENYEADTTEEERQTDLDNVARIHSELTSLKEMVAKSFNDKLKNMQFVTDWKNDVLTYLRSEFAELEQQYEKEELPAEISTQETKNESENKVYQPTGNEKVDGVKADCLENIAVVNTLLKNIKELIARQQNHARIAEALDSNYKALNNAFEMKNFAEELDHLVNAISNKMDLITDENAEELEKISKVNLQVSILLNYLNNAKSAVSKKINRFDEMNIMEENELKKGIAETIKNIRCEAELKKLNDDLDIIEDKSNLKKFLGKFTGRDKLDKTMLDQIKVRQTAIRKNFRNKMPLAYNYSIHEMIAEIEMFIKENKEDELVLEDVSLLRKIKDTLKKNFVILDSKVISIMDQKTGKNLPLASKKVSKKELIEIDTYRFLNRYGYDKSYDQKEPDYPDTMASEIKRIIDYIKSSDIL